MNLLLLHPHQYLHDNLWCLDERQGRHVRDILGLAEGDTFRAGILDGGVGMARVESIKNLSLIHI